MCRGLFAAIDIEISMTCKCHKKVMIHEILSNCNAKPYLTSLLLQEL